MKRLQLVAIALLYASRAWATPVTLSTALSGLNENPAVASAGTGLATVTLDPDAQTLQLVVTFSGLTSPTRRRISTAASRLLSRRTTWASPRPFRLFQGSRWV